MPDKQQRALVHLVTALGFLLAFVAFLAKTRYATVDDFIFKNLRWSAIVDRAGFLQIGRDPVPGFTSEFVVISQVLGLRYESVVGLPLLAPSFVFALTAIIRRLLPVSSPFILTFSMVAAWMLYFGCNSTLFCHTIGLTLFFTMLLLVMLRFESNHRHVSRRPCRGTIAISAIVVLISTNLISYKLMFLIVFTLIGIELSRPAISRNPSNSNTSTSDLSVLIAIGIVLALAFNWFFYDSFVPALRDSIENPFFGASRYLSSLRPEEPTALSKYYFVGNLSRLPLYVAWAALVSVGASLGAIVPLSKAVFGKPLSSSERVVFSLVLSSVVILVIYSSLGVLSLNYLFSAGLLAYAILPTSESASRRFGRRKKLLSVAVRFAIAFALVTTITMNVFAVADESYGGQTDRNSFCYLMEPSSWILTHLNKESTVSTDVLTGGYMLMEMDLSEGGESLRIHAFSEGDLLFLLEGVNQEMLTTHNEHSLGTVYVINYKQDHFSILGWQMFKAWSENALRIQENQHLDVVYSSGGIGVCLRNWD